MAAVRKAVLETGRGSCSGSYRRSNSCMIYKEKVIFFPKKVLFNAIMVFFKVFSFIMNLAFLQRSGNNRSTLIFSYTGS